MAKRFDDTKAIRFRGRKLNAKTILLLQSAEREIDRRLVITQGSFNPGKVTQSAHTHDQGGVIDLQPGPTTRRNVKALREAGFAAWHRMPSDFKPEDHVPEHIHAVSMFDHNLHSSAQNQKDQFKENPRKNGLLNKDKDTGPKFVAPTKAPLVKQTVRRREILFNETNDSVGYLQDMIGLVPDNFFGSVTKRFMKNQFGWGGKNPMDERLFTKLFPKSVFKLDATVEAPAIPVAVPATKKSSKKAAKKSSKKAAKIPAARTATAETVAKKG